MSSFKLGALNLPETEIILVKTLLRLFPKDQPFHWKFASSPPYDALLVDSSQTKACEPTTPAGPAVLRLSGFHAPDGPNILQRPIRADRLKQWLDSLGKTISQNLGQPQAANCAAPPNSDPMSAAPTGPEIVKTPVAEGQARHWPASTLFNLRRWPPATLLRRDPGRIRMASLLSRRALNVDDLAT